MTAMVSSCWPSRQHPGRCLLAVRLPKVRSLLLHGAVEQEIGGQGLIPLAQQECLNAAVTVKAQGPPDGQWLPCSSSVRCTATAPWRQTCMYQDFCESCTQRTFAGMRQEIL